ISRTRLYSLYITATSLISPLSLHDALPISNDCITSVAQFVYARLCLTVDYFVIVVSKSDLASLKGHKQLMCNIVTDPTIRDPPRSEEHTSELQSRFDIVCRLLLEKKNNKPS